MTTATTLPPLTLSADATALLQAYVQALAADKRAHAEHRATLQHRRIASIPEPEESGPLAAAQAAEVAALRTQHQLLERLVAEFTAAAEAAEAEGLRTHGEG